MNQKKNNKITIISIVAVIVVALFILALNFSQEKPDNDTEITLTTGEQNQESSNLNQLSIQDKIIATVNEKEITNKDVLTMQQAYLQQGQQISTNDTLEQLINQEILSQAAKESGYIQSLKEIEEFIITQLTKQNLSLEEYKQQLEKNGYTYQEQLEFAQEELAIQDYLKEEINPDLNITQEEIQEYYELIKQYSPAEGEAPSLEELTPQITSMIKQQKQQEEILNLIQELREEVNVKYF